MSDTIATPSNMVEQLNYKKEKEMVNKAIYCIEITCDCGNKRFIKKTDVFQVKKCKPCTFSERNQRRIQKLSEKRQKAKMDKALLPKD